MRSQSAAGTRVRTTEETSWYRALWVIHDNAAAGCVIPAMEHDGRRGGRVNVTPPKVMRELRRRGWVRERNRNWWLTARGIAAMWALDRDGWPTREWDPRARPAAQKAR
jgi:hypothetical protein